MDGGPNKDKDSQGRGKGYTVSVQKPHNRKERPHPNQKAGLNGVAVVPQQKDYDPSIRVQELINSVYDEGHRVHTTFSEMDILKPYNDEYEWREAARWVKYEENVEEGGKRWSKPHVASLSMVSLFQLREMLSEGVVLLDVDCHTFPEICDHIIQEWVAAHKLDSKLQPHMRDIMLKRHKHRHIKRGKHDRGLRSVSTMSEIAEDGDTKLDQLRRRSSVASLSNMQSSNDLFYQSPSSANLAGMEGESDTFHFKPNLQFMKKIPNESQVVNVMVGEVEDIPEKVSVFLRLKEPRSLEDISEVAYPTRFIFFCLGPEGFETEYVEVGRCISTLMVDEVFREVAYKARDTEDLIAGLDEFLQQVTVLPPAEWDPKIRIEPPLKVPSQDFRKTPSSSNLQTPIPVLKRPPEEEKAEHGDPTLVMSPIPFSGLYKDIKRKIPWYWSDYKDAIHIQCLASFVYVFLGTLTPNVTFGGLLGQATDQYMGVMECILAAAVTGVLFALFSGQPMNILGSTGPMLVLESIIYSFCKDNNWDFMPARVWVGLWTVLFILLIVVFNLSALVMYITRFTEESFASLIALIFIVEAFKKLFEIESHDAPINFHPGDPIPTNCTCLPVNCTGVAGYDFGLEYEAMNGTMMMSLNQSQWIIDHMNSTYNSSCEYLAELNYTSNMIPWEYLSKSACINLNGTLEGAGCYPKHYVGDVFLLSVLLFLGTFTIAWFLVGFKTTSVFPTVVRQRISDFAVLIAIVAMVVVDYLIGLDTPKLLVPETFEPTKKEARGWFINPMSDKNPWWIILVAAIPALLSTILIFLDQQITAVIVNRKENKLKKGHGYHLDMFILAFCVLIHSLMGLPWYVAATVSAIAHIKSLAKESETAAPGEKPTYLGVRENRVTALAIGVLSGLAVLITNVLKVIPMPVLYGVFLYMGVSALRGMQIIDRLVLFLQPVKYQPDLPYLRHVPLWRVHVFTIIQVICLAILWVVKSIKSISIVFPLMVLATGVVRKFLECGYAQEELKWLDDVLPSKKKDDDDHSDNTSTNSLPVVPMRGNINPAYITDDLKKMNGGNGDIGRTSFFIAEENEERKSSLPKEEDSSKL